MRVSPYLIFFAFLCLSISAQETGRLRGIVSDSNSGEFLPYANVYIDELQTGASTDERGLYLINRIPANKEYLLQVSFVGYQTKYVKVFIAPNKLTQLDITLSPEGVELGSIEKIGERIIQKNQTDIGLERISVKTLQALPKGVETDVLRSLQYVSGVRTTGDVSAKYYVRGGTSDQNLVKLNGITIYNPFHALGLFSVIDPEMINSVEFYKGGFTSEHGSRLSSVLSIISKDGNRNQFSASASASFLTNKLLVEGPIPNGSFILTGRKSFSNDILKKFLNEQSVPIDFYDASFKLNYSDDNIIKNGRFYIFGFLSGDNLEDDDPLSEDYKWSNNLIGFEWIQIYDMPLFSRFGVSLSKFEGKVIPNESEFKPRTNTVEDMNLSFDLNYVWPSKDELGLGLEIKLLNTKLVQSNSQGAVSDIEEFSGNFSLYLKYKFLRFEDFGVDIGTRFNLAGLTEGGGLYPEPRISMTYRLFPFLTLKGAAGLYQQEVATISDENEVISLFEPWTILPDYLKPSRALHLTFGTDWFLAENFLFKYEAYYKKIENLAAINEKKVFDSDPDLVNGNGEAYGSEFIINYSYNRFKINTSYSLSWAYKEVEGWLFYPKFDSRHSFNIGFEYNIGAGWSANAIWSYSSGLPFTPMIGFYDKYQTGNFFDVNPGNYTFNPYTILGDKNIERLPVYHRLDFTLSKKFDFNFIRMELDLSLINVYDRENIFYFKRDTGERVNMLPFLPTATLKVSI